MTKRLFPAIVGFFVVIAIWLCLKFILDVPDRYLPGPKSLSLAIVDIGPINWVRHTSSTLVRTLIGYAGGTILGITSVLVLFRFKALNYVLPVFHSLRAVPAVALVPFFLLWFGFSEWGRYLLVFLAMGLNIAAAAADTLERPNTADRILFKNFNAPINTKIFQYWLPRIIEGILPTLRFGIALALGAIVVSEMLGSQRGLGYLMQTSRATFSLNVIFVCAILLGIIATILDLCITRIWKHTVSWRI